MILPAEAALSVALFTADCLDRADAGEAEAQVLRRILTPLIKLRACRDARKVTGDAMEMRGGNGYIEEWIEPRLLRESHLGSIWEGTSNIIALDVVRAAAKAGAHRALARRLQADDRDALRRRGGGADRAPRCGPRPDRPRRPPDGDARAARQAATGLYHATAAALFAHEAEQLGDPVRLDLARLVLAHKLAPRDPLGASAPEDDAAADRVIDALVAARIAARIDV